MEKNTSRTWIFVIEMFYLVGLLVLALVYFHNPEVFEPKGTKAWGPVPMGVPWFGALGAVLLSMSGVFFYRGDDWDNGYWTWHVARPLIGAAVGIVSLLILKAGVLAVGSSPSAAPEGQSNVNLLYYLVAFLVGYREETFRDLIRRLSDVVLSSEDAKARRTPAAKAPVITKVAPASAVHTALQPGIVITGTGFTGTTAVMFDTTPAAAFKIDSDTQLTVTSPVMTGPGSAKLTVTTALGSGGTGFTFT